MTAKRKCCKKIAFNLSYALHIHVFSFKKQKKTWNEKKGIVLFIRPLMLLTKKKKWRHFEVYRKWQVYVHTQFLLSSFNFCFHFREKSFYLSRVRHSKWRWKLITQPTNRKSVRRRGKENVKNIKRRKENIDTDWIV